jgi:hypothetical protein
MATIGRYFLIMRSAQLKYQCLTPTRVPEEPSLVENRQNRACRSMGKIGDTYQRDVSMEHFFLDTFS